MDTDINTNSPNTAEPASAPVTPTPSAKQDSAASARASVELTVDAAKDAGDRLLDRVTQNAHDVIDSLSAKVSGVTTDTQDKLDQVLQTRDEWTTAARDAVREHPLLAIGGALLVGAAVNALLSSRRDR